MYIKSAAVLVYHLLEAMTVNVLQCARFPEKRLDVVCRGYSGVHGIHDGDFQAGAIEIQDHNFRSDAAAERGGTRLAILDRHAAVTPCMRSACCRLIAITSQFQSL